MVFFEFKLNRKIYNFKVNILPKNLVWVNNLKLITLSLFNYFKKEKLTFSRIYSLIRIRLINLNIKTLSQLIFFDKKAFYELISIPILVVSIGEPIAAQTLPPTQVGS